MKKDEVFSKEVVLKLKEQIKRLKRKNKKLQEELSNLSAVYYSR